MSEEINNYPTREKEIDLLAIFKRLWHKRKFIIIVTGYFMLFGLFIAIFSPTEYTATCVFVPQTGSKSGGGGLSSLAAMAGISLGDMGGGSETISPNVYPDLLKNMDFQKELMYTKVKFNKWDEPITLYDYYTNPEYSTFSLIGTIKKYTIGLPGLLIGAIKGSEKTDSNSTGNANLNYFTNKEYKCSKILARTISMTLNDKKGYINLNVNMPEAAVAAQIGDATLKLLQKYITRFKIARAQASLNFIEGRYNEAKIEYERKQTLYAEFQDANRVISSKVAATKEDQLKNEYTLAYTIYSELAKQLEQANIKVKEDTPILTAVKPFDVPFNRSKPQKSKILITWTFLGGILGCGMVLGFDWLKKMGSKWPKKWKIE